MFIYTPESRDYHTIEWGIAYGQEGLVMKSKDDNCYTHAIESEYTSLKKYEYLKEENPFYKERKLATPEEQNKMFILNEKYRVKTRYETQDLLIGYIMDEDNKVVYDGEKIEEIIKLFPKDISVSFNKRMQIIIEKPFELEVTFYKEKIIPKESLKDILDYDTDYAILKYIDHPIAFDYNGTLRFVEQTLTEKEELMDSDLNTAWVDYYNGKYTFPEMIKLYCKIGYSIGGFMEVYYESFLVRNPDDEDDAWLCPENEIVAILNGEMKSYDK